MPHASTKRDTVPKLITGVRWGLTCNPLTVFLSLQWGVSCLLEGVKPPNPPDISSTGNPNPNLIQIRLIL